MFATVIVLSSHSVTSMYACRVDGIGSTPLVQ